MTENYINILDYGAVPDGKTDCTSAIQNAMNDAANGCGIVEMPGGVYACGYVKVPNGIVVRGASTWNWSFGYGLAGSIIRLNDENALCCFDMSEANGTTIDGLTFDGKKLGKKVHGIYLKHNELSEKHDDIKIENVKCAFFSGDSIYLRNVNGCFIHHSMPCFSKGWGVSVSGRELFIIDCWLSGGLERGNFAICGSAKDIMLSANRIEDPYDNGIDTAVFYDDDSVSEAKISNITIANNYYCGADLYGISVIGNKNVKIYSINISGNVFDSNGQKKDGYSSSHVYLDTCNNVLVSNNTFFTKRGFWDPKSPINTHYGIVYHNVNNLTVTGNSVNYSAKLEAITDLGMNRGNINVFKNAGREICHKEGYMFPSWDDPQFDDAKKKI